MVKSYGWVVAHEILLSALGLGVVSILDSQFSFLVSPFLILDSRFSFLDSLFYSQVPGSRSHVPSPSPSRLTIRKRNDCSQKKVKQIFFN